MFDYTFLDLCTNKQLLYSNADHMHIFVYFGNYSRIE